MASGQGLTDQQRADAVERVLSGDIKCKGCKEWHKIDSEFRPTLGSKLCYYCWEKFLRNQ
jgi:hypothetical protein